MMRALVERIARRFGFVPADERAMPELVVFASYEQARHSGFQGRRHPDLPHAVAYWPGLGERGLAMRAVQRVTIADRTVVRDRDLRAVLRRRQAVFGDRAVWIEL